MIAIRSSSNHSLTEEPATDSRSRDSHQPRLEVKIHTQLMAATRHTLPFGTKLWRLKDKDRQEVLQVRQAARLNHHQDPRRRLGDDDINVPSTS